MFFSAHLFVYYQPGLFLFCCCQFFWFSFLFLFSNAIISQTVSIDLLKLKRAQDEYEQITCNNFNSILDHEKNKRSRRLRQISLVVLATVVAVAVSFLNAFMQFSLKSFALTMSVCFYLQICFSLLRSVLFRKLNDFWTHGINYKLNATQNVSFFHSFFQSLSLMFILCGITVQIASFFLCQTNSK